jgi:hypothetical protein
MAGYKIVERKFAPDGRTIPIAISSEKGTRKDRSPQIAQHIDLQ